MFEHHSSWYRVSQSIIFYTQIKIEVYLDVSINLDQIIITYISNTPILFHVIAPLLINEVSNDHPFAFKYTLYTLQYYIPSYFKITISA